MDILKESYKILAEAPKTVSDSWFDYMLQQYVKHYNAMSKATTPSTERQHKIIMQEIACSICTELAYQKGYERINDPVTAAPSWSVNAGADAVPTMLKIKDVAEKTGISYDHIRNLCLEDKIVYIRSGNKFLINYEKFLEYLNGVKE